VELLRRELSAGCVSHHRRQFSLTEAGRQMVEGDTSRLQSRQQADLSGENTAERSVTQPDVNSGRGVYALPTGSESVRARVDCGHGAVAEVGTKAHRTYRCVTSPLGRLTCEVAA
jgi:hypothetical protein